MIIEFLFALLLGLIAGTITGLTPGLHINTINSFLLGTILATSILSNSSSTTLITFIVSMSITHTFIDFIPSILLGAPEEDSFLSLLPGHQMLKNGEGHKAILLTILGSISAIPISLIFFPLIIYVAPKFYSSIQLFIPFILIFTSLFILFNQKNIFTAILIFILSGIIGFFSLNLPIKEPLLPLLSGLFGLSSIIFSIKQKTSIPIQKQYSIKDILNKNYLFVINLSFSSLISVLCSFLPGLSSGHAAIISSSIQKENSPKKFLISLGLINTVVMSISFVSAYSISRARTGSAAAILELSKNNISQSLLILIIVSIIISSIFAFFLSLKLSSISVKYIQKLNYSKISIITLIILISLNLVLTNPLGLLVLASSTFLGLFTLNSNSQRINLTGCLILPTILFYFF